MLNPNAGLPGFGVATWLGFWAFLPSLAVLKADPDVVLHRAGR